MMRYEGCTSCYGAGCEYCYGTGVVRVRSPILSNFRFWWGVWRESRRDPYGTAAADWHLAVSSLKYDIQYWWDWHIYRHESCCDVRHFLGRWTLGRHAEECDDLPF